MKSELMYKKVQRHIVCHLCSHKYYSDMPKGESECPNCEGEN